ncbi:MAG: hypothetical protein IMF20_02320 [Proteobacteria bacterium]|nr:hypothetical protein [Pseudomonadota bacterium]
MKTVSQKDLDKLKGKGWELTPESKKAAHEQRVASMMSKQVEAITNLAESVDGIRDALKADTGKDYTAIIDRLAMSIKEIKIEPVTVTEQREYRFIVKRGPDGMITEIEAVTK